MVLRAATPLSCGTWWSFFYFSPHMLIFVVACNVSVNEKSQWSTKMHNST